jgi:urease accessory protein UreE
VQGTDRVALPRLAWHLGNRHTPTAIECDGACGPAPHSLSRALSRPLAQSWRRP